MRRTIQHEDRQRDGLANVKLAISAFIHGSAPVERERVSLGHGHGTHRLDPTHSDGCILQAAETAAAVKVLQHRQTADFKRHV